MKSPLRRNITRNRNPSQPASSSRGVRCTTKRIGQFSVPNVQIVQPLRSSLDQAAPIVPVVPPLRSVQSLNAGPVKRSNLLGSIRKANFHVSRIPKRRNLAKSYFSRPRRRRSFPAEMAPSLFTRTLDLSMILRNLRLVLRARVSSSALRRVTTDAKGFPLLYTTTGAFLAFVAYYERGRDAFLNSTFVIALLFLRPFGSDPYV
jgi:hypothetical protein